MNTLTLVYHWLLVHRAVLWPLASAALLAIFHTHTPGEWVALGQKSPRWQGAIRLLRAAGLDPRDVLIGAVQIISGKAPMVDPRDAEIAQLRTRVAELSALRVPDGAPLVGEP